MVRFQSRLLFLIAISATLGVLFAEGLLMILPIDLSPAMMIMIKVLLPVLIIMVTIRLGRWIFCLEGNSHQAMESNAPQKLI